MRRYLAYFGYVWAHKFWVMRAGLLTGASFWRLLAHDWDKFWPSMFVAYAKTFYAEDGTKRFSPLNTGFTAAWNGHQKRSPHHWQYWVLGNDDGTALPLPMPDACVREMVADWFGAGRVITGRWDAASWYANNGHKMQLHEMTRSRVDVLVDRVARILNQK